MFFIFWKALIRLNKLEGLLVSFREVPESVYQTLKVGGYYISGRPLNCRTHVGTILVTISIFDNSVEKTVSKKELKRSKMNV